MFYLVNYFPDSHALCSAYDGALALSLAPSLNRCLSAPNTSTQERVAALLHSRSPVPKVGGAEIDVTETFHDLPKIATTAAFGRSARIVAQRTGR